MLQVQDYGSWRRVVLDRPEVRNAFNDELIEALRDQFLNLDSSIRAVVIGGNGKSFCAGGDLNWMRKAAGYTEEQNAADAQKLAELFEAITQSHAVFIAEVHGAAFGGGCGLVAAADVALAEVGTKFSFSEVRLGLVPATISPFVVQKIGSGHARALFTTGEVFDSARALRIGLIHDEVAVGSLFVEVKKRVADILRNGPEAVKTSKWLAQQSPLDKIASSQLLAQARASDEGKEGVQAFLDKRPAAFVEEVPEIL